MVTSPRDFLARLTFVQSEGILILGRDPRYAALLDPLNVLLFTQLFGQLLAQSDAPTGRTHLVIDELTVAAGEGKPLPGFKDICERGASRGVVVAVAFQSYADVKALYQDSGDAILGMLQHQVFLRAGDYPTAEFGMKNFGKKREWAKAPQGVLRKPFLAAGLNGTWCRLRNFLSSNPRPRKTAFRVIGLARAATMRACFICPAPGWPRTSRRGARM